MDASRPGIAIGMAWRRRVPQRDSWQLYRLSNAWFNMKSQSAPGDDNADAQTWLLKIGGSNC